MPDPVGYDANQLAAFRRLNELRAAAGLGLLAQERHLDQAAQAHVAWELANNLYQHEETPGTVGFTGARVTQRVNATGMTGRGGAEVLTAGLAPAAAIDALFNGVYHRSALIDSNPVDVGICYSGNSSLAVANPMAVIVSSIQDDGPRQNGQAPRLEMDGVVVWPYQGAVDVFLAMNPESPRANDSISPGVPISIHVEYWRELTVSVFRLILKATGAQIDCQLFLQSSDVNRIIGVNEAFLIPRLELAAMSDFQVEFSGAIDGKIFEKAWIFSTGNRRWSV